MPMSIGERVAPRRATIKKLVSGQKKRPVTKMTGLSFSS
jgi:hypothetical protein